MTMIEEKRKELEDKCLINKANLDYSILIVSESILKGFNLGVLLAQEEFLEVFRFILFDELRIRQGMKPQTNKHLDRIINHIKTRVEQQLSLEEKK